MIPLLKPRTLAVFLAAASLASGLVRGSPAWAQAAAGQADTWDSRQRQPGQTQVLQREKRADIAPSKTQQNATQSKLNQIQSELTPGAPAGTGSNPAR